jgi:hypothetical protein
VISRLPGLLLFLPVPLVLWLFTQAPLGVGPSLGLGAALMVTHRFYARPYARRRAEGRCLWCGGPAGGGPRLQVKEPAGTTAWRACRALHARRLEAVLGWAGRHARSLRLGVLGTLVLFLPGALLADRGRLGPVTAADAVAFFRTGIALTVLPLGWLSLRARLPSREAPRVPFPLHIQALVGTLTVVWLFRLVGLLWLGLGLGHALRRLGSM